MTKNCIAGEWVAASEASPDINPSGLREQGRYVAEFYTTLKTAYTFDGNGSYVLKTKGSE